MSDIIKLAVHVEVDALIEELAGAVEQNGSILAARAFMEAIGVAIWNNFDEEAGLALVRSLVSAFATKQAIEPARCLPEEMIDNAG